MTNESTSPSTDLRFAFGANWQDYSALIGQDQIMAAVARLDTLVGSANIDRRSFLDIGCGSGLHTLAALRLGADRVEAIDYDQLSVATATSVLARFWDGAHYRVVRGDILDPALSVDPAEVVYSWGVLHHTGNMQEAIRAAARLVVPGGLLVLALYGKTRYCGVWTRIKRWYCQTDAAGKLAAERWYVRLFGAYLLLRGKRLKDHVAGYRNKRGMDFMHDVRDWLGGYPYESISPKELAAILEPLGFSCVKQVVKRRSGLFGSGCDEYVYRAP